MTSSLRSDVFLTPTATSANSLYPDPVAEAISGATDRFRYAEVRGSHHQHLDQELIALALAVAVVRVLHSHKREIAQVSEYPTMQRLQNANDVRNLDLGMGRPVGWWLDRAAYVRKLVIAETANTMTAALTPGLARIARRGIRHGLTLLTSPATYRSREAAQLANAADLTSQAWAKHYAAALGEGLGDKSADGLLVSLSTLQRSAAAERYAWQIVHSLVGLPHGQALSVTQIAQKRLETYFGTRRTMTVRDFAADVGKLLLSQRAKRISQNESEVAYNFGTQLLLMNAQQKGWLAADAEKVWVTAVDERVCPVCAPMDSVAVRIDEPFLVRPHEGLLKHAVKLWVPPAHPNCRCRIVPRKAVERGIITRTARFSRDEVGRARLKSRLADIVHQSPEWVDQTAQGE